MNKVIFGLFALSLVFAANVRADEDLICGRVSEVFANKKHAGVWLHSEKNPGQVFGGTFERKDEVRFLIIATTALQNKNLTVCLNSDFAAGAGIQKIAIK